MNEKNLKPIRSVNEAREKGKKGGISSGKKRREKKLLKEYMNNLLDMPVFDEKYEEILKSIGFPTKEMCNRLVLCFSLFLKAVDSGDVNAFKEIRDLIGEKAYSEKDGEINENMLVLADLINKPHKNRYISDFEEK